MSALEDEVADPLKALGGTPQYRFADRIGRRWTFDWAWPTLLLAVELEGGAYILGRHVRGAGFEADAVKYNYAEVTGWHVLRFGPKAIKAGIVERSVALYLTRYSMPPAQWAEYLAQLVKDSPKAPKKRKPRNNPVATDSGGPLDARRR